MQHGDVAFHIDSASTSRFGQMFFSFLFWKITVADTFLGLQLFSLSTLHTMVFWVLLKSHLSV